MTISDDDANWKQPDTDGPASSQQHEAKNADLRKSDTTPTSQEDTDGEECCCDCYEHHEFRSSGARIARGRKLLQASTPNAKSRGAARGVKGQASTPRKTLCSHCDCFPVIHQ